MDRRLKAHFFICTNERDENHPRGCCKAKNSPALLDRFKQEIKARGLKGKVRAQRAGCLDVCEDGPSVVVYPHGIWLGKVAESDVSDLIDRVLEGKEIPRQFRVPGK